jgi:multiple sugar transport system permease protein
MATTLSHGKTAAPTWSRYRVRTKIVQPILDHALLIGVGLLFFFPFAWLFVTSIKTAAEISLIPPTLWPKVPQWENYIDAVTFIPFFQYFLNTLTIYIGKVLGAVISCSLVAYGFSRLEWPGREVVFGLVLATMMLPAQVTMIPLYIIFDRLGWIGTYYPLILPSWFGYAFGIFLFRQFFRTIPTELSEAARIDGCSEPGIYARIIMPLAMPAIATLVLFEFTWTWNDFFQPLLYLNDQARWTLSLGLLQFRSQHATRWELLMAASFLVTLPSVILYFFGQKTFVQGISTTGFK